jgi:DNA polymerase-3 subunit alpha
MSHVCPLEFELLFERFLDENRVEAPDIDIDFDQDRRGEIFDYITEAYGKENVARLGTFGTMGAKMSIKDVGRALELPIPFVADVTKLIPDKPGTEIDHALNGKKNRETGEIEVSPNEELKKRLVQEPPLKELIDYAQKIEGLARNTGVHACGVIIADKPLTEYVPLQLDKKEVVVTQWEGKDVEAAGLLKMDILGLQNLTILAHSIQLVKQTTGKTIDPYRLPLEDKKTFELLCRGETKGIFQLEGGGMRELLQRMKPDRFRDIIATIALYRPGPLEGGMVDQYVAVKHGKAQAEYVHPVLEEVLGETNGVMIYQEQIMQIMNRLGNIPLAGSYASIKAISKKKDLGKYREQFVKGAKANGLTEKKANDIFELIVKFSGYGFNKSHSTAYAMVAYMTAYLKAHYPVEFMAALLCGDISRRNFSSKDSTVEHIEDCERMGIKIIPPDVNTSKQLYSVEEGKIVFALTAIKSCGDWAADKIVQARESEGKFKDLFDFCERVENRACNRATIEALIKAGAFDSMGVHRAQLFQMVDPALKAGQGAAADAAKGQGSLFGGDDEPVSVTPKGLPPISEWTDKEKSSYEKEVLGFYLTSHPLQEFAEGFAMFRSHECAEAVILPDKTPVVLAGAVNDIKVAAGKNPKPDKPNTYAMFTLEDASGPVRSIMWSDAYDQFSPLIKNDSVVIMRGRVDRSRSAETSAETVSPDGNFIVDEAFAIDEAPKKLCRGLAIALNEQHHSTASVDTLLKMLQEHPGSEPVELSLRLRDGATAIFRGGRTTVGVTPALFRRITDLLGTDSAMVLIKPPLVKKTYRSY